jgi:pre-rRNA-processing protein TSR3
MKLTFPPTVIVRHRREKPQKCTILPLEGREDLIFLPYPVRNGDIELRDYVRLGPEGKPLSSGDSTRGLLLLDASWRWARIMTRDFQHVPERALPNYRTAYPRKSKRGTDPSNGLASVEALFLAYRILGRPTEGLLDLYRWADEFLRLNELG